MESEQLQVGAARRTQAAMIEPELVRQIRALEAMRWGSKRIARELGVALMTVKRYRRGSAEAEAQHRPTRRALDDEQRAKARELFDTAAEGQRRRRDTAFGRNGHRRGYLPLERASAVSSSSSSRGGTSAAVFC